MKFITLLAVSTALILLPLCCASCAQMNANDGLVPRMSAQANLPYTPNVMSNGLMAAPSGGSANVSPLAETRKAYWSTP